MGMFLGLDCLASIFVRARGAHHDNPSKAKYLQLMTQTMGLASRRDSGGRKVLATELKGAPAPFLFTSMSMFTILL